MTDTDRVPPDLDALDRTLGGIRFRPRDSLGVEVAGRLRRGGQWEGDARPRRTRRPLVMLVAFATAALALWVVWSRTAVPVDRCCYDLDGGVDPDDGVLVVADRGERVRRVAVYEDADGSRSFTEGDRVRFARGSSPTLVGPGSGPLITIRHCCTDFDGGGPPDDGLLVIGVPPDRVMMAALYEESSARARSGGLLR